MRLVFAASPTLPFLLLLAVLPGKVFSQVACDYNNSGGQGSNGTADEFCAAQYWNGSHCRPDGVCSNPFSKGCLHTLLNDEEWENVSMVPPEHLHRLKSQFRVCNGDDPPGSTDCLSLHDNPAYAYLGESYVEMRIHNAMLLNDWVLQIILSELLQVPTTIENGLPNLENSFYQERFDYKNHSILQFTDGLSGDALYEASLFNVKSKPGGDCRLAGPEEFPGQYYSCAHVFPEFWADGTHQSSSSTVKRLQEEGYIQRQQDLGAIGSRGLFITKFTLDQDPSLASYRGLAGEENREKMARMFQIPCTWKEYCEEVSSTNCTTPDKVAQRGPSSLEESDRYHAPKLYTGHFRATARNNCTNNPFCTGHVGDLPCSDGFVSLLKPWIATLDIALSSDGKKKGAYSYMDIAELWEAANRTRSHLITMGQAPSAIHSGHVHTETEMVRIEFPETSEGCWIEDLEDQVCQAKTLEEAEQVFGPGVVCDYAPVSLVLLKSTTLPEASEPPDLPPELHSPANQAISRFFISQFSLARMVNKWVDRRIDPYGFDPRLASCIWVRDHLADILQTMVPPTYPRAYELNSDSPVRHAAMAVGGIAIITTVGCGIFVWMRRTSAVIVYSQVDFLLILLLGLLMVSVSSIVNTLSPSNASCVSEVWLIEIGYTLELVPLIVKVTAINRLMSAAKKMKRVTIHRSNLFLTVGAWTVFSATGMTVWTILDPPKPTRYLFVSDEQNEYGETVVSVEMYCSSSVVYWLYGAMLIHFMLLMWAAVLAFQMRGVQQRFNESQVLAAVIYVQCLFLAFRAVLMAIPKSAVSPVLGVGIASLITSLDSLATLLIYFVPKIVLHHRASFSESSHTPGMAQDQSHSDYNHAILRPTHRSSQDTCTSQRPSRYSEEAPPEDEPLDEPHSILSILVEELQTENRTLRRTTEELQNDNLALTARVEELVETVSLLKQNVPQEEERATMALEPIAPVSDMRKSTNW